MNLLKIALILMLPVLYSGEIFASQSSSKWLCSQTFSKDLEASKDIKIDSIESLGAAVSRGLILSPEQLGVFEIYRKIFMGEPSQGVNQKNLASVYTALDKYPEAKRLDFPEVEMVGVDKLYPRTKSLDKFITSQIKMATSIKGNLLNPFHSNAKKYWQNLLDYSGNKFDRYLRGALGKDLLEKLENDKISDLDKLEALFKRLKQIRPKLKPIGRNANNRNTSNLSQALVDIVHISGFTQESYREALKSEEGLEVINSFDRVLDFQDEFAMKLGYEGHFIELQKEQANQKKKDRNQEALRLPSPVQSVGSYPALLNSLKQEIESSELILRKRDPVRVRELTVIERGFRSCLGGSDCSTRTYFDKAYDPNFHYFTMTEVSHKSSGHATVVLGTARSESTDKEVQVAFLDKLQNVDPDKIIDF